MSICNVLSQNGMCMEWVEIWNKTEMLYRTFVELRTPGVYNVQIHESDRYVANCCCSIVPSDFKWGSIWY